MCGDQQRDGCQHLFSVMEVYDQVHPCDVRTLDRDDEQKQVCLVGIDLPIQVDQTGHELT